MLCAWNAVSCSDLSLLLIYEPAPFFMELFQKFKSAGTEESEFGDEQWKKILFPTQQEN